MNASGDWESLIRSLLAPPVFDGDSERRGWPGAAEYGPAVPVYRPAGGRRQHYLYSAARTMGLRVIILMVLTPSAMLYLMRRGSCARACAYSRSA